MILFVGQAPGQHNTVPFDGQSGRALAKLLGIAYEQMRKEHRFMNIVDAWQGKDGKGDRFDWENDSVVKVRRAICGAESIVFCGKETAKACGIKHEFLKLFTFDGLPAIVLPHPSGVSHWYNDPLNRRLAAARLRLFLG